MLKIKIKFYFEMIRDLIFRLLDSERSNINVGIGLTMI